MPTWNADKPALADQVSANIPHIKENLEELHDVVEAITNGTLGTTAAASFKVDALAADSIGLTAALATDHTASGVTASLTAGEDLVFGNIAYYKAADSKMWKADADAASTMGFLALAIATIAADDTGDFLLLGFARDDTWTWTIQKKIFVSATAGELTATEPVAGDITQCVGYSTHADRMFFNPNHKEPESAKIKTGNYTGDGTTGQAITGVGFRPKSVFITKHPTTEVATEVHWKLDPTWADYSVQLSTAAGQEVVITDSKINSLDADGFTVDDNEADTDPNKNTIVYDYLALG